MADVLLNFSSQWPTIQVAKVVRDPQDTGGIPSGMSQYSRKIPHGLGYPPFAIGMSYNDINSGYDLMVGLDVDDTYVYVPNTVTGRTHLECAVIYALDITTPYSYTQYSSTVGETVQDTSSKGIDMRDFLLHSRSVGPMALNVVTKTYTKSDMTLEYNSPLTYPTFSFGWVRGAVNVGNTVAGIWKNAPLAGQAWPVMFTDGYKSSIANTLFNQQFDANFNPIPGTGDMAADRATILVLRNPAIITNNTVNVTI